MCKCYVSKVIMGKFKTIKNLILELDNDPTVIDNLKMTDNKGKNGK